MANNTHSLENGHLPMHHDEDRATCSDRVRMNAIVGLVLFVAGDLLLALSTAFNVAAGVQVVIALAGVVAIMCGLYYVLCFLNRGVIVSQAGLTYRSWRGKRYDWSWDDDVTVIRHAGKNMRIEFRASGHKIVFYGYSENAKTLDDWLYEHDKYAAM